MKISEKWLREWVDPPLDTDQLTAQLTAAGLEVDAARPVAPDLEGVVVAKVTEVLPHPQADALRLCRADAGEGEAVEVVCGAPNVFAGMTAPLARPGARLAGGVRVRRRTIRGIRSNGMLCSSAELGLGEDAGGILELPAEARPGDDLGACLGLDDVSIDIELTPNRGDCLGISGIAREVAVLNRLPLREPDMRPVEPACALEVEIALESHADCPRYAGRVVRHIDPMAPTPLWLREKLRRCGLRSIGAVVDVTNYVMLELGQPMHAFDFRALEGGVRVRRARRGETLVLLDESELELDAQALVIADGSAPVALAGIMGGAQSSVTGRTVDILLESAFFDARTVALEARRRGLHTDASHRFERGVSTELQVLAIERATALLLDIVGGEPGPTVDARSAQGMPVAAPIRLRARRIERLLGTSPPAAEVSDILGRLGMRVEPEGEDWRVTPPPFRPDIALEADLIEEVARITGYHTIPETMPAAPLEMAPNPEAPVSLSSIRGRLVDRGYHEAITYSFVDPGIQALFAPGEREIPLANPISSDLAVMRTSLWPGLLTALLYNLNRQQHRVRLFEAGLTFQRLAEGLRQATAVGGVVTGPVLPDQWGAGASDSDFFDVKSDLEAVFRLTGCLDEFEFSPAAFAGLHPGQSAEIRRGGRYCGRLGTLHPRIALEWKLAVPVLLFELEMDVLARGEVVKYAALSRFPSVRRDISITVDEAVTALALRNCVGQAGIDVLHNLELFDVYRGEGIDSGKKSVSLGLTFQAPSRTLNDAEVDAHITTILDSLTKHLGATLRG